MIGAIAAYTHGHPWPGGGSVSFERNDVRAVGQLSAYNDFVKRYLVRLADGREAFVKASDQVEVDQKWLRGIGRRLNKDLRQKAIEGTLVVPSRDLGAVVHWKELESAPRATGEAMTTSALRALMKIAISDARVASTGDGSWTIRFKCHSHLKTVREQIKSLGLDELYHDVEGSRWDWSYVVHVQVKE